MLMRSKLRSRGLRSTRLRSKRVIPMAFFFERPSDWRTPRASQGTRRTKPQIQPNIHSHPQYRKILLDRMSYKLYYVNYEMRLESRPVNCLCNPLILSLESGFPLGLLSVVLRG